MSMAFHDDVQKSAAIEGTTEAVRGPAPLEATLERLDKALAVHGEALSRLGSTLEPVMHPATPSEVRNDQADGFGASQVVRKVTDALERVESMTDVVRGFASRLEV